MGRRAEQMEWLDAGKADLEFHRCMVQAAGNPLVEMLWEALARHVLIVFGREFRQERGEGDLMDQHVRLRDVLLSASPDDLEVEIERHIMRLRPPWRPKPSR